jgi:hypothetical protein
MIRKTTRYRKPDLLFLVTLFVGFGVLVTSVAQAAEPLIMNKAGSQPVEQSLSNQWLQSVWSLDLTEKIQNWKPMVRVDSDGHGVRLSRPFGAHGPALRLSASVPDETRRSLRAGGDHQIGASSADSPDAYIYLQKRW